MKYYITSDLHSFYTPLKKSLTALDYDLANPDHTLVILGDIFDRGNETKELYNFLKQIPAERLVLVKGNHEYLLDELLTKKLPDDFDYSNGTVLTCCHMAFRSKTVANKNAIQLQDLSYELSYSNLWKTFAYNDSDTKADWSIVSYAKAKWRNIVNRVKQSEIYTWYKKLNWVNYWEVDNFIGVHSFVPVKPAAQCSCIKDKQLSAIYQGYTDWFEADSNWRTADAWRWELSTWGCPYVFMEANLFPEQGKKTLICGHYAASEFHRHFESELPGNYNYDTYFNKDLIALDSTVARSKQTNVLLIDEAGKCIDQHNKSIN